MSYDAFISHAQKNDNEANLVYAYLKNNGIHCWIDSEDIIAGNNFEKQIVDAIKSSKTIILIHSLQSNNSSGVLSEIRIAQKNKIPIISFRIENVPYSEEIDYYIGSKQWIDAFPLPIDTYIPKIIDNMTKYIKNPETSIESSSTNELLPSINPLFNETKPSLPNSQINGRVTTNNNVIGLGGAYVAIVNPDNPSQVYYDTTADSMGYFYFNRIKPTNGKRLYVIYANLTPFGYGYSTRFGITGDETYSIPMGVIIFPKPARITLTLKNNIINANGHDSTIIEAYVYDPLGNPAPDGFPIKFSVSDLSGKMGLLMPFNQEGKKGSTIYAMTSNGSALVKFGWAKKGGENIITAISEKNPDVYASNKLLIKDVRGLLKFPF